MPRDHLHEFRVQGFACVQDALLQLSPLHALIGPNDSGKSTLLRAIQEFATWAATGSVAADSGSSGCVLTASINDGAAARLEYTSTRGREGGEFVTNRLGESVHIASLSAVAQLAVVRLAEPGTRPLLAIQQGVPEGSKHLEVMPAQTAVLQRMAAWAGPGTCQRL